MENNLPLKHCVRCGRWVHEVNEVGICFNCAKEIKHNGIRTRLIMELVSLYGTIDRIKNKSDMQHTKDKFNKVIMFLDFSQEEQIYYNNELNQRGI